MDRIIYTDIIGSSDDVAGPFTVVGCFDGEHYEAVEFYEPVEFDALQFARDLFPGFTDAELTELRDFDGL